MKYRLQSRANLEMLAVAKHYEEEKPGLGEDFLSGFHASINIILQFPEVGSPFEKGCRKCIIPDFPYNLVYQIKGGKIVIIAVMHQSRKPGYWKKRL